MTFQARTKKSSLVSVTTYYNAGELYILQSVLKCDKTLHKALMFWKYWQSEEEKSGYNGGVHVWWIGRNVVFVCPWCPSPDGHSMCRHDVPSSKTMSRNGLNYMISKIFHVFQKAVSFKSFKAESIN